MLKHIVMWKLKPLAEGKTKEENALWMKQNLESLQKIIPEIVSIEVGINFNKNDMAYDAVLISRFKDEHDLEIYKTHPEHIKISNYCKKIRENRVAVDFYEEQ